MQSAPSTETDRGQWAGNTQEKCGDMEGEKSSTQGHAGPNRGTMGEMEVGGHKPGIGVKPQRGASTLRHITEGKSKARERKLGGLDPRCVPT